MLTVIEIHISHLRFNLKVIRIYHIQRFLSANFFFTKKKFFTQTFFCAKFFRTKKMFTQNFFDPTFFLRKQIFLRKIFFMQKFCIKKIFA